MAASSLLTLLDDIATLLDDVAVMSKIAVKKTAGVLGDDLALNAQQVTGVKADRELPVVWAVAKGSFINKLILVPAALLISAFIPWLVIPLLMLGGLYLCYEGVEKLVHSAQAKDEDKQAEHLAAVTNPHVDMVEYEKQKIKGAIRTDFILSAEIIVITLGTVASADLLTQVTVLSVIAVAMTVGVYGLVAGIVRLDDVGLYLSRLTGVSNWRGFLRRLGRAIVNAAPYLMKGLSIVGTAAMFMVGGSILLHGVHVLTPLVEQMTAYVGSIKGLGAVFAPVIPVLCETVFGIVMGAVALGVITLVGKAFGKSDQSAH